MYPILLKYFYLFYYIKKNKNFKFFILLDMMYNLIHRTFLIKRALNVPFNSKLISFLLKKKFKKQTVQSLNKIRNFNIKKPLKFKFRNKKINTRHIKSIFEIRRRILKKYFNFILEYITNTITSTFISVGNRKELYKLFTKKYKRFFNMSKKYTDKVTFLNFTIDFFEKIKELFFHTEAFSKVNNLFVEFFSIILFETSYNKLIQIYKHKKIFLNHKRDKNKATYFFNLTHFFLYRLDYFLLQCLPILSVMDIRRFISKGNVSINGHIVTQYDYFFNKYDILKLSNYLYLLLNNIYIINLKLYFDFLTYHSIVSRSGKHSYFILLYKAYNEIKKCYEIKKQYYLKLLCSRLKLRKKNKRSLFYFYHINSTDQYFSLKKNKFLFNEYDLFSNELYSFFNSSRNEKLFVGTNYYNHESYLSTIENYNKEIKFHFYTTRLLRQTHVLEQAQLKMSGNHELLGFGNITLSCRPTLHSLLQRSLNLLPLTNYLSLFFYLYNYPLFYYYSYNNKIIISPMIFKSILYEKKKLFSFFSIMYGNANANVSSIFETYSI